MWDDSHIFRWRQISISGGSQSTIWYSLRQDCRDAQKKYVMLCMTRISQQECRGILEFCKRNSQFIYNNDKKITIYQSKRTQRERKIQKKYSIQHFLRKIKFIQKKLDSHILLWYYNIRCTREIHFSWKNEKNLKRKLKNFLID